MKYMKHLCVILICVISIFILGDIYYIQNGIGITEVYWLLTVLMEFFLITTSWSLGVLMMED